MPGLAFGQTYNSGVKYIKVNRFDSGGLDRSNYLGQLQSITLTYPDRSAIEYPIVTIQEQANFYLYGITPGYNTSSKGDINDYGFRATTTTLSSVINTFYYTASNFTVNSGNSLNNLNASTGVFGLTQTPNTKIQFIFTASITPTTPKDLAFALIDNTFTGETPFISSTVFSVPAGPGADVIRSGSIILGPNILDSVQFVEGIPNIGIGFYKQTGTGDPLITSLNVTASNITPAFSGSSSLVLFDPSVINFDYNDYNPLLDNAETPQFSNVFMDIDYSQDPLTPINFGLIISGTADRAFVQDSNYSSKAWSNIRYNGSKTTSYRIN